MTDAEINSAISTASNLLFADVNLDDLLADSVEEARRRMDDVIMKIGNRKDADYFFEHPNELPDSLAGKVIRLVIDNADHLKRQLKAKRWTEYSSNGPARDFVDKFKLYCQLLNMLPREVVGTLSLTYAEAAELMLPVETEIRQVAENKPILVKFADFKSGQMDLIQWLASNDDELVIKDEYTINELEQSMAEVASKVGGNKEREVLEGELFSSLLIETVDDETISLSNGEYWVVKSLVNDLLGYKQARLDDVPVTINIPEKSSLHSQLEHHFTVLRARGEIKTALADHISNITNIRSRATGRIGRYLLRRKRYEPDTDINAIFQFIETIVWIHAHGGNLKKGAEFDSSQEQQGLAYQLVASKLSDHLNRALVDFDSRYSLGSLDSDALQRSAAQLVLLQAQTKNDLNEALLSIEAGAEAGEEVARLTEGAS